MTGGKRFSAQGGLKAILLLSAAGAALIGDAGRAHAATISLTYQNNGTSGAPDYTYPSGTGGAGQDVTMNNTVPNLVTVLGGTSPGDTLQTSQTATGGDGGVAYYGGTGGKAGNATSIQSFNDTNAAVVQTTTNANGGAGGGANGYGSSGVAANGGTATATSNITSVGTLTENVQAYGGIGGTGTSAFSATPGAGGASNASATGSTINGNSLDLTVNAVGGSGGSAYGPGNMGGAAAMATASANGQSDTGQVNVSVTQAGGSGGNGGNAAGGASGADSVLTNAASGSTTGTLLLSQMASGGNGGSTDGGRAGNGGMGKSVLTLTDNAASFLSGTTTAWGGTGGYSSSADVYAPTLGQYVTIDGTPGNGGNALAKTILSSTVYNTQVSAWAYAYGGSAGSGSQSNNTVVYGTDGTAIAIAKASSIGSGYFFGSNALAQVQSSQGGVAKAISLQTDGAGNSVMAFAKVPAIAGNQMVATSGTSIGGWNPSLGSAAGQASSYGTLNPNGGTWTLSSIGNASANFTAVASGAMSAASPYGVTPNATYTMAANYQFSLNAGNDLLLGMLGDQTTGGGFSSATLKAWVNGTQLVNSTYGSVSALEAALANPFDLGAATGSENVKIVFTEVLAGLQNVSNGYDWNYIFAAATSGTITGGVTNVSAVPLPGAVLLFGSGLASLAGFAARRRGRERV